MKHINIEIKAKCDDIDRIRQILNTGNAVFKGVDHQVDTYFNTNSGRLKLREGTIENVLIQYDREDKDGPKESDILLYKSSSNNLLKELLTKALGIHVIVDKEREIFFIGNVKFHLDKVKDLGQFIEVEAIGKENDDKENLLQQCKFYLNLFGVDKNDLIPVSYSDMIIEKQRSMNNADAHAYISN
ncbi:MAG: class IV adenylate cyclase [Bacteroidales bacterium]|nr:class IV adenylate cyclase [Bacteroidales bacterium]MBN2758809.1 class IV adenylate cyclase [Bacteroidales bacterium]